MNFWDFFFPPRCLACHQFLKSADVFCGPCEALFPRLSPPHCHRCLHPFSSADTSSHLCGNCLTHPATCQQIRAAGTYKGILHDLVVRLKYHGEERLAVGLGRRMAHEIREIKFDLILPIPLHKNRLRERGFNQAHLLAKEIARVSKIDLDPFILIKTKSTEAQALLPAEERRKNLKGAFQLKDSSKIKGKRILLIDDVYTTGTTIEEASKVLVRQGAETVEALVLARGV